VSNKKSKKQEARLAKDLIGGRAQIASGALDYWDNDVCSDAFLMEAKYTEAKSYSIKVKYWDETEKNAFSIGKLPVLVIEFDPQRKGLAVIRYEDFIEFDRLLGGLCG
jgi:hypothetical protein